MRHRCAMHWPNARDKDFDGDHIVTPHATAFRTNTIGFSIVDELSKRSLSGGWRFLRLASPAGLGKRRRCGPLNGLLGYTSKRIVPRPASLRNQFTRVLVFWLDLVSCGGKDVKCLLPKSERKGHRIDVESSPP